MTFSHMVVVPCGQHVVHSEVLACSVDPRHLAVGEIVYVPLGRAFMVPDNTDAELTFARAHRLTRTAASRTAGVRTA